MAKKPKQVAPDAPLKGRGRGARPGHDKEKASVASEPGSPGAATRWETEANRRRDLAKRQEVIVEDVVLEVTPENVLRNLSYLAFYDPRNVHNVDGSLKRLNELDRVTAFALVGIEVTHTGEVLKYRFANRVPPLDMLGKYLKIFEGDLKDKGALDALLLEFRKQYAIASKEKVNDDDEATNA